MSTPLREQSKVRLRAVLIREETPGRFSVIRWGGATRIQTGAPGAAAIRWMRRRHLTLEQVKRALAERYQTTPDRIDLTSLVASLSRAGLIASVDGCRIPDRRPVTPGTLSRFLLRFYLKGAAMRLCGRNLRFSLLRRVSFVLTRMDWSAAVESKADQALERLLRLSQPPGAAGPPEKFRREYRANFVWKMAEVQCLMASTREAVDRWMERYVGLEGRDGLDSALALGRGVIICPFRFGCPPLIPMALIRAGYSLTQITVPGGVPYAEGFSGFQKLRPSFGVYREVRDLGLSRYRTLLSTLEAGGMVVWLPDFLGGPDDNPDEASASKQRTVLPKSRIVVPFCGGQIYMNRWVGTFAGITGSPVIPAALVRRDGQIRLMLGAPILPQAQSGSPARRAEAVDRLLFAGLESFVQRFPAWLAWRHVLHAEEPRERAAGIAIESVL